MGKAAAYRAGAAVVCADCGATLVDVVAAPTATSPAFASAAGATRRTWPRHVVVAGLVSLVVAALTEAATFVTLPYVDHFAFMQWAGITPGSFVGLFSTLSVPQVSVVALGITPWMAAAFLVEVAAAAVPRWRPLRAGAFEGRARLTRASLVIGAGCAVVQALLLTRWLAGMSGAWYDSVAPELWAVGPQLVVAATLVGGACLMRLAVFVVERHGLGNGFAVILAGAAVVDLCLDLWRTVVALQDGFMTPFAVVVALGVAGIPAVLAWRLVRPLASPDDDDHGDDGALFVARPSAGIVPASIVFMVPATLSLLAMLPLPLDLPLAAPGHPSTLAIVGGAAVAAALVPLCAAWFSSPARAALVQARLAGRAMPTGVELEQARAAARAALPTTWLLNGALVGAWAAGSWLPWTFDAFALLAIAVIARDLWGEAEARHSLPRPVSVAQLHRYDLLGPVVAALAAENIAFALRGARYRALSHFFAPYVPIEILVDDGENATKAQAIVRAIVVKACTSSQH